MVRHVMQAVYSCLDSTGYDHISGAIPTPLIHRPPAGRILAPDHRHELGPLGPMPAASGTSCKRAGFRGRSLSGQRANAGTVICDERADMLGNDSPLVSNGPRPYGPSTMESQMISTVQKVKAERALIRRFGAGINGYSHSAPGTAEHNGRLHVAFKCRDEESGSWIRYVVTGRTGRLAIIAEHDSGAAYAAASEAADSPRYPAAEAAPVTAEAAPAAEHELGPEPAEAAPVICAGCGAMPDDETGHESWCRAELESMAELAPGRTDAAAFNAACDHVIHEIKLAALDPADLRGVPVPHDMPAEAVYAELQRAELAEAAEHELGPVNPCRDLGLALRDHLDGRPVAEFHDAADGSLAEIDTGRTVESVDVSDAMNPVIYLSDGRRFTVRIIATS